MPEILSITNTYMELLNCPRSLTVAIMLRYCEYDQVVSLKTPPHDYADAASYHLAACATDWLRKYPGLPVKADRVQAAKQSWYQSEEECRVTNIVLRDRRLNTDSLNLLIDVASDFIRDVLGPCPLDLSPRFGPGATVSDKSTHVTVLDKVTSIPTLTEDARCLLPLWQDTSWARAHHTQEGYIRHSPLVKTVRGNTFFTVPKTALTDRGCSKGPSLNVSYQLAVARVMRDRLRVNAHLDLTDGQERHQVLAMIGSHDGTHATIDSERASDTLALSLVKRLFAKTPLWLELLLTLREPETHIDDTWVHLHKFSAMGNGYTFELETLVFLSLCFAVGWAQSLGDDNPSPWALLKSGSITVFGDDIIVPTQMYSDVTRLLTSCGFTVNLKKSYFEGEFRESCGGDFFRGIDVNTPKLKKEISNPADWFSVHNLLKKRFVDAYPNRDGQRLLRKVKDQLPRKYRDMYGPTFLGDTVLHGWYGPNIRTRARRVFEKVGPLWPNEDRFITDGNQWVCTLTTLAPKLERAAFDDYDENAQLAYFLYTGRSEPPTRRPTRQVKVKVVTLEGDYHIIFGDYVPKAPRWLAKSPFARYFGITPEGTYVG